VRIEAVRGEGAFAVDESNGGDFKTFGLSRMRSTASPDANAKIILQPAGYHAF
jgi:hypothetical protein